MFLLWVYVGSFRLLPQMAFLYSQYLYAVMHSFDTHYCMQLCAILCVLDMHSCALLCSFVYFKYVGFAHVLQKVRQTFMVHMCVMHITDSR